MQGLIDYVRSKTSADQGFHSTLSSLLENHSQHHVGLVLSERLINIPVQVMAPMYRMLSEEIDEAIKEVSLLFDLILWMRHLVCSCRVKRIDSRTICSFHGFTVCRRKKRKRCSLPSEIRSDTSRRHIPRRSRVKTAYMGSIQKTKKSSK